MSKSKSLKGTEVPAVGFGTYRMNEAECEEAVSTALERGYRHIDTAMAYENESAVGRAIAESNVDREDIFLTTKVKGYPELLEHDAFLEAANDCLERLNVEYVDLLLVHWWVPQGDMKGVFQAMDQLVDQEKVRNAGVSNFSIDELQRAMRLSETPILTNQVECHPYFYTNQQNMINYCQEQDVLLTAYSPLAEGLVADDGTLDSIGERYGKSAPQVSIRWLVQQDNVVTIPMSMNPQHIADNRNIFDFELSDQEMQRIAKSRGPPLYELLKEGGPVYRVRSTVGPRIPDPVRKALTSTGSMALKFVQ